MKMIVAGVGAAVLASYGLFGQAAAFDVASVKRSQPSKAVEFGANFGLRPSSNGLTGQGITLQQLVLWAYGIKPNQLAAPAWIDSERYDISAKTESGVTVAQLRTMLQGLLGERFHLAVHTELRPSQLYELTIGSTGLKLRPGSNESRFTTSSTSGSRTISGTLPFDKLAETLARYVGHEVVDRTDDKGVYQVSLTWRRDDVPAGVLPIGALDDAPSIFTALEDVGLALRTRRSSASVLVVDHADRIPEAN